MKLRKYLKETGIKQYVFAQKVGITPYTLRCIIEGSRDIHLSLAIRIEDLTIDKDGKIQVPCRDLVNPIYLKRHEQTAKELKEKTALEVSQELNGSHEKEDL